MTNSSKKTSFRSNSWTLPMGLSRLEHWLASQGVDVDSLKSDRQTLMFTSQLSGENADWPMRGKSCVPELVRLQKLICPATALSVSAHAGRQPWKQQREPFLRSTGPASQCRDVSPETLQEITKRYCFGKQ